MNAKRFWAALTAATLLPALSVQAATLPNRTFGPGYAVTTEGTLYQWSEALPTATLEGVRSVADGNPSTLLVIDEHNTLYQKTGAATQKIAENMADAVLAGDEIVALDVDGVLWRFLSEQTGQIAFPMLTGVTGFAADGENFFAIDEGGVLWAWGSNEQGQLGLGDTYARYAPVKALENAAAVALCGGSSAWALTRDGSLYMSGAFTEKYTAAKFTFVNNEVAAVYPAPNGEAVAFLKNDGTLWGAGAPALTRQSLYDGKSPFVKVLSRVADVTMNQTRNQYLARLTDGSLWSWGVEHQSEGEGVGVLGVSPTQITDTVTGMAAAEYTYLALTGNTLYSWGFSLGGYGIGLVQKSAGKPQRLLTNVATPGEAEGDGEKTTGITVSVNGVQLLFDQEPLIQNGRVLTPLRSVLEALGAQIQWDDASHTLTAVVNKTTLKLTLGEATLYKNGQALPLDVPAQAVNGRTLIPLRALAEALDAQVDWDGAARAVTVTKKMYQKPYAAVQNINTQSRYAPTPRSLEIAATYPTGFGLLAEHVVSYKLEGSPVATADLYETSGILALRFVAEGSTLLTVTALEGNTLTTRTYRLTVDNGAAAVGQTNFWNSTPKN